MSTGTLELYKIDVSPVEFKTDTALKLLMLDNLQRIGKSLKKVSDPTTVKKQVE